MQNKLYFGDNLGILREHVADASIDLIYLDPPFNSSATNGFSVAALRERRFFDAEKGRRSQTAATASGEESAAQITAFEDTWGWGLESEAADNEIVTQGPKKLADLKARVAHTSRFCDVCDQANRCMASRDELIATVNRVSD